MKSWRRAFEDGTEAAAVASPLSTAVPAWKRFEQFRDVLPMNDPARRDRNA